MTLKTKSDVAFIKIKGDEKKDVLLAVKKAMETADWKQFVKGKKIFIKTNLLSDQLVPGQCTSPWVLEGVIFVLKESGAKLYLGDADVATSKQVEPAAKIWGVLDLCKKYHVTFVNLSKEKTIKVNMKGKIFKEIEVPKILIDVDCIITVPVVKTHNVTTMTCSLKNQWGCIPTFRHQYHLVAGTCIADINDYLNVAFAVADATVCLEENGPRVGCPKIVNAIMASNDRVAMDSAACKLMGINPKNVEHIIESYNRGIGTANFEIIGDKLINQHFKMPKIEDHPIVRIELFLRKIPIISWLVFKTPFFKIPAFFASRYNSVWWYYKKGKRLACDVVDSHPLYEKEFKPLLMKIKKYDAPK